VTIAHLVGLLLEELTSTLVATVGGIAAVIRHIIRR